ncbi:glycosyltransferase family 2 protein [Vibrio harveyi]|uniref:glycosyltransferase family 2 protein n=1 Tax=Vibrio harveyi TaxID=669 RepID=UPI00237F8486|nr:glycosyltransferase family 2 protein [Vibrio harveyi]HDM8070133.1 glycosyltransferase family 2 protein [Vibrio harveyi]
MKISILIAAYNVERYIEKCIKSCINQTYKNIEIIVVNDGSTDKTAEVISKIADPRLKVITQKNSGLIDARKSGLRNATGDYILFLDGDDWIKNSTIEKLLGKAISGNFDIVGFKYYLAYECGNLVEESYYKSYHRLEGYEFLENILTGCIVPHIVNKLIRTRFLEENNVKFPGGISFAEDVAISCAIGMKKPLACVVDEHLYYYYQREEALTKRASEKWLEMKSVTDFIYTELSENGLIEVYKDEFEYLVYTHHFVLKFDYFYDGSSVGKKLKNNWKCMNVSISSNKFYKRQSFKLRTGQFLKRNLPRVATLILRVRKKFK